MISSFNNGARVGGSRILIQLLAFVLLLLGAAFTAQAENCSDYPGGILDGFAGTPAPDQLQIDRNCTIRNYPASNPLGTNFSFLTQPGQTDQRWLVIFDNVVHTGQMACNAVAQHRIWFVNGSSTSIKEGCQNYLIPVEKIDKKNPDGQTTATIGVPFTYKLTMPVLFAPATNVVIDYSGSADDLHSTVITDDLNATGADLTYISHVAYWEDTGAAVPHTFSNAGGLLTFSDFPIIPAGRQIIIELTVVLDDTPANAIGTQFVNTAKWFFGRLIDNVFYEPLPGEWGVSPPLTIAAPRLVVDKTGPATLNIGQWGQFSLSVQNTGLTDAWDVTILDRFPDVATGGMCSRTPEVLGARVFAADGVTPVPGKGPLTAGIDFSLSYNAAPTCELSLAMLTAAGVIGPNERLVITYRTQLDADTQDGVALTNVAGAIQWFNAGSTVAGRQPYTRTLTDGTVGTLDHEDAHTVVVAMTGYFFEKTVANRTTGVSPAITATTGDTLRYTLRLRTTNEALVNARIYDELDALNASAAFVPGTLTLVAFPAGADISNTSSTGGPRGTGVIDIRNLNVPAASEISVQFDVRLAANIVDGTTVANQSAARLADGTTFALSDDPNVNGQADPSVMGDEDPTRVVVTLPPPTALAKANTQLTAAVGEVFTYRITVPAVPDTAPLYNVRILDDLTASAADLRFISVTKVSGSQPWTPVNTGTATSLVIEDTTVGIDIPAGEQIVVEIAVQLENTTTNVIGLQFTNTAAYVYSRINDNAVSQRPGSPGTTPPMTIIGPDRLTLEKARSGQHDQWRLRDVHARRKQPEHRHGVGPDDHRPATEHGHGWHVRCRTDAGDSPGFPGRRPHAGLRATRRGHRLLRDLRRRTGLHAAHHDAVGGRSCHCRQPHDRALPGATRCGQPDQRHVHEHRRRHRVVQCRPVEPPDRGSVRDVYARPYRRHGWFARPRGRPHGQRASAPVREDGRQRDYEPEPRRRGDARRPPQVQPACHEPRRRRAQQFLGAR
jgi:large repetitive protein